MMENKELNNMEINDNDMDQVAGGAAVGFGTWLKSKFTKNNTSTPPKGKKYVSNGIALTSTGRAADGFEIISEDNYGKMLNDNTKRLSHNQKIIDKVKGSRQATQVGKYSEEIVAKTRGTGKRIY